jgi:RNA-binding protein
MSDTSLPGSRLGRLKSMGQLLKPAVHVGKSGLSAALLAEVDRALAEQELIKVKFDALKEEKKVLAPQLAAKTGSRVVQRVGHVVVLYREHPDPERRKIRFQAGDSTL